MSREANAQIVNVHFATFTVRLSVKQILGKWLPP